MKKIICIVLTLFIATICTVQAQKLVYSEPDKDDVRSLNFEVVGKFDGNFLIYKNYRDNHYLSLYDNDMKMIKKDKLNFFPDKLINVDFITYPDFFYALYQYQKRNVVYVMAAKMDVAGKLIGEPQILDTTEINFFASNRIYSIINSENKQYIAAVKINARDEKQHIVGSVFFDKELKQLHKSHINIAMPDKNDFLTEFHIDNEGSLVFLKAAGTSQNDNINKLNLYTKNMTADTTTSYSIPTNNIYLDDVKIKVNNANQQYLITSFYSKQRRGNIEGLFSYLWDNKSKQQAAYSAIVFTDELRNDARGESNTKSAFNDYFLQNIIMRKDGGYLITAESYYTSTRGGGYNRWDYLNNSAFWTPSQYYYWRNYGYYYPWGRFNSLSITRYYADNIVVASFDASGKQEWSNVIRKSQYDDNTDNFIGYTTVNTGGELHFIYNQLEKRTLLLSDQSISPDGQLQRNPVFKNLDRGYEFMPRYGKQVSARQMIIPCQYRNYICFAKVEI